MKAFKSFGKYFKAPSYSTIFTVSLLGGYVAYHNSRRTIRAAEDDDAVSKHLREDIIHSNRQIPAGAL